MARSTIWCRDKASSAPPTTIFPRLTDPVFESAEAGTSYAQTSGFVIDSQPRTISNLIVDQTANNPAAYATAYDAGADGLLGTADDVLKDGVEIVTSPGLDGVFGTADDRAGFLLRQRCAGRGPVCRLQLLDDVLRPVLRSRPRPRDQGRQRHGLHSAAAGRSALRPGQPRPISWC